MLTQIDKLLEENKSQMYLDFEKIVNINSFSSNLDGIDKALNALVDIASEKDIELQKVYSSKNVRPHLMHGKEKEKDYFAFIGHFDTVHPASSDFNTYIDEGDTIKGPGTNDMKAGLIVALYSYSILKQLYPNRDLPIKILFNSDEEIGSTDSQEIVEKEFINAKAGFIFEPGRIGGEITVQRKGLAALDIEVIGKPAHAGVAPWEGVNAILASCEIIQKLEALNDYENGIIVGCNEIHSGIARNVVPPYSKITVDVRFEKMSQKEPLYKKIEEILNTPTTVGAEVKYDLHLNRPPFEKTEASGELAKLYRSIAKKLNYSCEEMATGGGSDGNFLSAMGVPTIDGLGAIGDFSHTKKEYIVKDSLVYRTKIFVLFMIDLLENN
ncbi:M20/M25/M40 family metallo-hydrolase [Sulfurospirillum arcachonense]|uniref:M20/M25/M40 family metallo-hydrolase n=1 Tax=Sulfurospirillum arcachonense TaxID=57666 RepID=UPI000468A06A|nr:M20/M25/M40 family metallo-hydrolase [Sulfurospirillum arcachonense]